MRDDTEKQRNAGMILSYISIGISYLVALLYTPVLLRLLGQSEYGLYTLSTSVVNYLNLLSFGIGASYVRFYAKSKSAGDDKKVASLNSMYVLIFSGIGILTLLIGSVLIINVDIFLGKGLTTDELSRSKVIMNILVINIAIAFPASVFSSYLTANERFIIIRFVQILKQILNPLLVLPLLLMGKSSISIAVIMLLVNVVADVCYIFYALKKVNMSFGLEYLDIKLLVEIFCFSFFIFLNSVVNEINWNLDKFLLGIFHGTTAVAVYGVAAQFNTCIMSFSTAVSNVYVPQVNQIMSKENGKKEINALFIRLGRIQFIIVFFIIMLFAILGRPFIIFWAGTGYKDAYWIILLLAASELIPLTQNIGIEIQRAQNKHHFRAILYFIIALLNLCISIPLGRKFGGIGCALGTALGQIIGNIIIMDWYYYRKLDIDIKEYWRNVIKLFPALVLPISAGAFIGRINITHFWQIMVMGEIMAVLYGGSMWVMGLNESEKMAVRRLAAGLRR